MTAIQPSNLVLKRRLTALALVAVSALALSACANKVDVYEKTGALPGDYRSNHPITIEDQIATLDVPVSVDTVHLTAAGQVEHRVLRAVVPREPHRDHRRRRALGFRRTRRPPPASPSRSSTRSSITASIPRAISYRIYKADKSEKVAPVRIAFNHLAAQTTPCGPWDDQITVNPQNENYDAFGCATQQNLAAMVENPLDLLYPRAVSPADAARRAAVLDKYRKGEVTGAAKPSNEGGTAATGVGN